MSEMKLLVEIINNEFKFEYKIGTTFSCGTIPFNRSGLKLFVELIEHLKINETNLEERNYEAYKAYAYTEAYPEIIKKIKENIKKK